MRRHIGLNSSQVVVMRCRRVSPDVALGPATPGKREHIVIPLFAFASSITPW